MLETMPEQLSDIIISRRSVRAYLGRDVEDAQIKNILDTARHTQSGGNMQPWHVHVLRKKSISNLYTAIADEVNLKGFIGNGDYQYYPQKPVNPYSKRIRQSGMDLHAALEIGRRDTSAARSQRMRNFEFFGAPVGMIITMNKQLAQGSWIDVGMFLNTLSLVISSHGLSSCLQASFSSYGHIVREVLDLQAEQVVICGLALGYEDGAHPVNSLPRRRMTVDEFTVFHP